MSSCIAHHKFIGFAADGVFAVVTWLVILVAPFVVVAKGAGGLSPRAPWTTSRLHGSPEPPVPLRIVPAFPAIHFQKPTSVQEMVAASRMLVTEQDGKIFSFVKHKDAQQAELVVDLTKQLPDDLVEQGLSLFHATLHPEFHRNRFMYVCYVHPGDGKHTRVSRFTLTGTTPPRALEDSEKVVITWPAGGHNGGCLQFGTDGFLYISAGDGSGPNPPDGLTAGQDVSNLFGTILRINVDQSNGENGYSVPPDNPFVDIPGVRPEIWAYGLRNPWKFGVDRETGEIFVADNGWESWEMIHRIERGGNCGWPIMEGRALLRTEVERGPTPIIPPVKDHPHSEANSVIGGLIYRSDTLPGLDGAFVYGDYITGTIWAVRPDKDNSYSATTLVDTDQRIVAFAQGSVGEIYVLDYDYTGQIYQLLPSDLQDTSAEFPRKLSETGLFASVAALQPAAGVVPYAVKAARWTDGADAQRWVAIPGHGQIKLPTHNREPAVYPEGTVFVKQLNLARDTKENPLKLETQILHFENGTWTPYSYLWDEQGKDATLVESIGTRRSFQLAELTEKDGVRERTWHVNAINECRLCHNAGSNFVLGFQPNQLDRPLPDNVSNQLEALVEQLVINHSPPLTPNDTVQLVDPHDRSQDIDDRARSYLHANCSMCHHPGGNAIVSFYLARDLPFNELNTNKGTGIGTFGMHNAKIIVPGDPFRSLVMYRMSKLGYARMPYIGSHVVDSQGVALVAEWIRSLPRDTSDQVSAPLNSGSATAEALQILTNNNSEQYEDAIEELIKSTEGSLALLVEMHAGTLDDKRSKAAVAIGGQTFNGNIRGLFETFIPESQRRPSLGRNFDPQAILSKAGDAGRGKLIFFSDSARCRACHEIDDQTNSLGPTLSEISQKYLQLNEMLQHVVQPSLKVEDKHAAYMLVTTDGRLLTGLIVKETKDEVVLKTVERRVFVIPRDEIDEIQRSPKSLMPDQVLADLTAQEAADLFAYIRSLRF